MSTHADPQASVESSSSNLSTPIKHTVRRDASARTPAEGPLLSDSTMKLPIQIDQITRAAATPISHPVFSARELNSRTPAPAPTLSDAVLKLLTPAQLERLQQARDQNALLRKQCQDKDSVIEKLKHSVQDVEAEEDGRTNAMLKTLERMYKQHNQLAAHLSSEEKEKQRLEGRLTDMVAENAKLGDSLLEEEKVIRQKLEAQIKVVETQRIELLEKVRREEASLQAVQPQESTCSSLSQSYDASVMSAKAARPLTPGIIAEPATTSHGAISVSHSAPILPVDSAAPTPLSSRLGSSFCSYPPSTALSGSALASDRSMLMVLQREIDRLENFRSESHTRTAQYQQAYRDMLEKVIAAKKDEEKQRTAVEETKNKLEKAKRLTRELIASHEMMLENMADREMHARSRRRAPSQASSVEDRTSTIGECATPTVISSRTSSVPPHVSLV